MDKWEYTTKLAAFLQENGKSMSVPELAEHLLKNEQVKESDAIHRNGIATYKFVGTLHKWLQSQGRTDDAKNVAQAFTM